MSLTDWLAAGAEPGQMTPEEVRRRQKLLAVREEQATAKLESLLEQRDSLFHRGSDTSSPVLRRVLARRYGRTDTDVRALERELARIGKELAGLSCIRQMHRDGFALSAPGDCTPLLTLLDDPTATEQEFANLLCTRLRGSAALEPPTGPVARTGPDLMEIWTRLDRGEFNSSQDALKALGER